MAPVLALTIFVVAFWFIASERADKVKTVLVAAGLMAVLGLIPGAGVFYSEHEGIDWNVIFLLLGMMVIVGVPLPGARELLAHLHERQVPFAIATSGARHTAGSALALLGLPDDVPVVTRDLVERAKPDPHLFLAAARRLGVDPAHCFVVGDSVWDLLAAQRAGALGIGLLSGGYGREELERSGAYRVYADPAEMLTRLEEVGVRPIR